MRVEVMVEFVETVMLVPVNEVFSSLARRSWPPFKPESGF